MDEEVKESLARSQATIDELEKEMNAIDLI